MNSTTNSLPWATPILVLATVDDGSNFNDAFHMTIASVAVITVLLVGSLSLWRTTSDHCIPSGPWGLPILGSFPFLTNYPELTLDHWAKKFGPIYSLKLGNQLFVVLSDPGVVKDIMITNGAIFSSRRNMFIKAQTILKGRAITSSGYTDRWRRHRRIAAAFFQPRVIDAYNGDIDIEAASMIKCMYEASCGGAVSINPARHAGRYFMNNMLTITFGMRTHSYDDPMVVEVLRMSREFMNCTGPLSNLIDYVGFLQYIPTSMRSRGRKLHSDFKKTYGDLIRNIDAKMKQGACVSHCLTKTMLEIREKEGLDELDMTMLASAFMVAGVETPAGIISWFIALVSTRPEIQAKAHAELNSVVGRKRMPSIDDLENLTYCRSIIKEVERFRNPFWLGTPHASTEDFQYNGYYIPKDTVVICNTYTMHFNAQRYPDPFVFNPDRYADDILSSSESSNLPDPYQRDHWMYGVGRRICPGSAFADRSLLLAISRLLWAFQISEVLGEPIDLTEYDGLSGRSPLPYNAMFRPRHNVSAILENVPL
ncbi:hypothetical protein EUX98_g1430 [Antrodiella citrinella]|uniref:Cytochrome P450 n=1 Tax=Antrodiella citrinella TaxID=2447956 RepID=A0A4S4N4E1_9APHY|nr:hypothetical protein EUX98_g1430 [Antrodiella citrinella]